MGQSQIKYFDLALATCITPATGLSTLEAALGEQLPGSVSFCPPSPPPDSPVMDLEPKLATG